MSHNPRKGGVFGVVVYVVVFVVFVVVVFVVVVILFLFLFIQNPYFKVLSKSARIL